jgi:hypothetical protein
MFAYNSHMGAHYCRLQGPFPTVYVVRCKRCARNVPAGVAEFPINNTVVRCPLCAELRRYRPSEVFLGWPDPLVEEQKASYRHRPYVRRLPHRSEE